MTLHRDGHRTQLIKFDFNLCTLFSLCSRQRCCIVRKCVNEPTSQFTTTSFEWYLFLGRKPGNHRLFILTSSCFSAYEIRWLVPGKKFVVLAYFRLKKKLFNADNERITCMNTALLKRYLVVAIIQNFV